MAKKLISMRNMHSDEAEEIRALLTEKHVDHYETPEGNWGISMPAIWLHNEDDFERAKSILDQYHQARSERIRSEYNELKREGMHRTLLDELRENPVKFIAFTALAAAILYFSVAPFIAFLED